MVKPFNQDQFIIWIPTAPTISEYSAQRRNEVAIASCGSRDMIIRRRINGAAQRILEFHRSYDTSKEERENMKNIVLQMQYFHFFPLFSS